MIIEIPEGIPEKKIKSIFKKGEIENSKKA